MRAWVIFVLMLAVAVGAQELTWPAPAGFRSETLRFPLDFAPDIPYMGFEEIRFAPGFGDPKSDGFFSYSFVWLIEDSAEIDAAVLEADLTRYFEGLMAAVARKKPRGKPQPTSVRVSPGAELTSPGFPALPLYTASVRTWDAFYTGNQLHLQMNVFAPRSGVEGRRLLYFEASPRLDQEPVKKLLVPLRAALNLG